MCKGFFCCFHVRVRHFARYLQFQFVLVCLCKSVKMSSSSLQCASFLLFSVCTVTAAVRYFIVFLCSVFLLIAFLFVYKWLFVQ